jgi:hypothetical protein
MSDNSSFDGQGQSNSSQPQFFRVDPSSIPTPWYVFRRDHFVNQVTSKVNRMIHGVGRPLTKEEGDAITEHMTRDTAIEASAWLFAIPPAVVMTLRGRASFRFPFYSPKGIRFNPQAFPTTRFQLLSGSNAEAAWHFTRGAAYGKLIQWFMVAPLASILGGLLVSTSLVNDKRLTSLLADFKSNVQTNARRRGFMTGGGATSYSEVLQQYIQEFNTSLELTQEIGRRLLAVREKLEDTDLDAQTRNKLLQNERTLEEEFTKQAEKLRIFYERALQLKRNMGRDAESIPFPSNPFQQPDSQRQESDDAHASFGQNPQQAQSQDWAASAPPRGGQYQVPPATPLVEDKWDNQDDVLDDASPMAPSQRSKTAGYEAPPTSGSAWDRLRKQARSGQGSAPQESKPQGDSAWAAARQGPKEEFTYDKAEEEKNLAKEQAQKEFDAMLERERRGETDDQPPPKSRGRWR